IDRENAYPGIGTRDGAAEAEDFAGKHPIEKANGVPAAVVAGNCDVNEAEGGVRVAESDGRDVHVRSLLDGLLVSAWVGHDHEARLLEGAGDVVGEGAGREAAGDGLGARGGPLAVRLRRDDDDVGGVLNGGDDARGKHQLLPGLADADDVDAVRGGGVSGRERTARPSSRQQGRRARGASGVEETAGDDRTEDAPVRPTLPDVREHGLLGVLHADVRLRSQEELNVLLGVGEDLGDVRHRCEAC
ncbi:MAG: hypothetical protein BJ554DRAFT_1989, partial [Olpidium bornovanus]